MNDSITLALARCFSAHELVMEVLDLFPRSILKGQLPPELLDQLLNLASQVLAHPQASPDASAKLAGQLSEQRELRPDQPGVQH